MADTKRARTSEIQQGSNKYSVSTEFLRFLIHSKVEQLQPSNGIVYVAQREENIVDVWKGLIKYNFTSCPVLQKTKSKWYGFIDLADITESIVQTFGQQKLETTDDFWEALAKDEMFIKKKVNDIMAYPISRRNPFHPVIKGYSLFSAIEILSRENELHRIPVLDNMQNRKLVNIITQSQVIDFLNKNLELMGNIREMPIGNVAHSHHKVIRIQQTAVAMEAFKLMHYNDVSGVAVINEHGKLMGAITTNDLKLIHADATMFKRLYSPIKDFMKNSLKEETLRPRHLVVATETDTIETVIKKMEKNRVHRVFMVDKDHKPIGVIAMQDILAEIVKQC